MSEHLKYCYNEKAKTEVSPKETNQGNNMNMWLQTKKN